MPKAFTYGEKRTRDASHRLRMASVTFLDQWDHSAKVHIYEEFLHCFPGINIRTNLVGKKDYHNVKLDKRMVIFLYKWLRRYINKKGWEVK